MIFLIIQEKNDNKNDISDNKGLIETNTSNISIIYQK